MQGAVKQCELLRGRQVLPLCYSLSRLHNKLRIRETSVTLSDIHRVRTDSLRLRQGGQLTAASIELDIDKVEGLQPCPKLRGSAPDSLSNNPELPALLPQHHQDSVCFSQFVGT